MTDEGKHSGAFVLRSPMARWRPWVSDGVWIAHESHPIFGRLAALMPRNAWWSLGQNGATAVDGKTAPDLAALMGSVQTSLGRCVVERGEFERMASIEDAQTAALADLNEGTSRLVEAVGDDGQLWLFDQNTIEAADFRREWDWRLALNPTSGAVHVAQMLIGVDRKGRARFALMPMATTDADAASASGASRG